MICPIQSKKFVLSNTHGNGYIKNSARTTSFFFAKYWQIQVDWKHHMRLCSVGQRFFHFFVSLLLICPYTVKNIRIEQHTWKRLYKNFYSYNLVFFSRNIDKYKLIENTICVFARSDNVFFTFLYPRCWSVPIQSKIFVLGNTHGNGYINKFYLYNLVFFLQNYTNTSWLKTPYASLLCRMTFFSLFCICWSVLYSQKYSYWATHMLTAI